MALLCAAAALLAVMVYETTNLCRGIGGVCAWSYA